MPSRWRGLIFSHEACMRTHILIGLLFCIAPAVSGQITQALQQGVVSYKNPQSVYIKFNTTSQIMQGDTLFVLVENVLIPALIVSNTSSISVVGTALSGVSLEAGNTVYFRPRPVPVLLDPVTEDEMQEPEVTPSVPVPEEVIPDATRTRAARQEKIRGRVAASFYSNVFSEVRTIQRLRYTFSMQAQNLGGSRVSAETFVSFRHQLDDWKAMQNPRSKALRVYNLAFRYDLSDRTALTVGRKVNTSMANIGAIDGVQAEHAAGQFVFGAFAGTRPDHTDFGLNTRLLQYGAFAAHQTQSRHGAIQTSVALAEQRNGGMTDRRFMYMQHSSNLTKTISVFSSFEFDLYQRIDSTPENTLNLTSMYLSLQYRPGRKLTLSGSYDARRNVIFFETFRNTIDALIEQETRQGLRFRANYRPFKFVSAGGAFGYRFQKSQGNDATHMHLYVTHSRVPRINASVAGSATVISNPFLQGAVYGVRMSRDVIRQKLFAEVEYRRVHYLYSRSELTLTQDLVGINCSWRVRKNLTLSADYESAFQSQTTQHRLHLNVIQRF